MVGYQCQSNKCIRNGQVDHQSLTNAQSFKLSKLTGVGFQYSDPFDYCNIFCDNWLSSQFWPQAHCRKSSFCPGSNNSGIWSATRSLSLKQLNRPRRKCGWPERSAQDIRPLASGQLYVETVPCVSSLRRLRRGTYLTSCQSQSRSSSPFVNEEQTPSRAKGGSEICKWEWRWSSVSHLSVTSRDTLSVCWIHKTY